MYGLELKHDSAEATQGFLKIKGTFWGFAIKRIGVDIGVPGLRETTT